MKAGENTLNAHCARVVTRSITAAGGCYDKTCFLTDYIDFMTADPPRHPDTYAESFHRGSVLGLILGLGTGWPVDAFFNQLTDRQAIDAKITSLIDHIQETSAIQ
jgi:hypothetical protein